LQPNSKAHALPPVYHSLAFVFLFRTVHNEKSATHANRCSVLTILCLTPRCFSSPVRHDVEVVMPERGLCALVHFWTNIFAGQQHAIKIKGIWEMKDGDFLTIANRIEEFVGREVLTPPVRAAGTTSGAAQVACSSPVRGSTRPTEACSATSRSTADHCNSPNGLSTSLKFAQFDEFCSPRGSRDRSGQQFVLPRQTRHHRSKIDAYRPKMLIGGDPLQLQRGKVFAFPGTSPMTRGYWSEVDSPFRQLIP
jgi:hypothetical protein